MRYSLFALFPVLLMPACGQRPVEQAVIRPSEVTDFHLLYDQNCSGCHGSHGQGALSVAIGSPVYLSIADDHLIRRTIEEGTEGTAMPAFTRRAGGFLNDAQIDILVRGIRGWFRRGTSPPPPAYVASLSGDATRGQEVFGKYCLSCHGKDTPALADPAYLALVTDQHLRTVTITGMPNLGMPDWRSYAKPLSDADVTDVVAWLAMHRTPLSTSLSH